MRSMRHVKRGRNPKQRTGKNRTSTKNEAYKRHNAAKQQWIGKTQFWEPKSALSEKRLAEKVINESFHSAPVQNKVNARPKKVAEHKPSASQPKKALEPQQKNLKKNSAVEEVAQKKAVQKTEAVSNGVAGKLEKFAPKKKEVVEQLRVEINEKQYSDNDDMKSSVDSGVDVAHHKEDQKPENVLNGAERLAELTGEVVDAVDEEPCVLRKASRCGEFCGCDRIRDEHYHHDHDSVEDERIVEDPPKEAAVCETKQAKSAKKQKQEAKPAEANDSQSTRFSANVVKFVDMAQKKLAAPENAKETEPKIAPVTVTKAASAPVPTPASVVVKKVDPKRRERQYKLLPRDIEFCSYMMETHGENFEAMANDPKNVYRDTANGISRKLRIFRESPQYEEYVASKNV
ncbi:hypothetical protein L596_003911 [Steinernema carpocapsae]|uniref:Uncharacterized protein n=1 Tax=Steinernema carpocapsae TaxID=34508 RepID=A0A4V6I7Y0_STECR|nr:hypothetical protein L596_003911 [Steinernema carpocapsae]